MKKVCVIGHPIQQSLSPVIHNYWINKFNITAQYSAVDVAPDALKEFIIYARQNLVGFNVTTPHKENIMQYCDTVSDLAKKVGAVNTVVISDDGTIFGDNTDVYGFQTALENQAFTAMIKNHKEQNYMESCFKKAVIIGAGGAARAGICAFKNMGFENIIVCNRTPEKAEKLAKEFSVDYCDFSEFNAVSGDANCIVNTSIAGMNDKNFLPFDLHNVQKNCVVYDIVYKPLQTRLLQNATDLGLPTAQGLDMLLYQAVAGFEYWFGKNPDVSMELKTKLLDAVNK